MNDRLLTAERDLRRVLDDLYWKADAEHAKAALDRFLAALPKGWHLTNQPTADAQLLALREAARNYIDYDYGVGEGSPPRCFASDPFRDLPSGIASGRLRIEARVLALFMQAAESVIGGHGEFRGWPSDVLPKIEHEARTLLEGSDK